MHSPLAASSSVVPEFGISKLTNSWFGSFGSQSLSSLTQCLVQGATSNDAACNCLGARVHIRFACARRRLLKPPRAAPQLGRKVTERAAL